MFAIPDTHNDRGLTTKELPVNTLGSGRFAAFLLAATAAPEVLAQATHKHLRLCVEYPAALPDTAGALYQDNHVRVMLGCMGTATIIGTDRWDEKLLINILRISAPPAWARAWVYWFWLDGRDLGVVWCEPWRIEITEALRTGTNELEIVVVNEWVNRLIGDSGQPPEKRLTWTTWNPYKANSPLLESGLLGPVTIQSDLLKTQAQP